MQRQRGGGVEGALCNSAMHQQVFYVREVEQPETCRTDNSPTITWTQWKGCDT